MDQVEYDELDTAGVLVELGRLRRVRDDADRTILVLAGHFADLHDPTEIAALPGTDLPGRERGVRLGGAGTPRVRDLAIAELAAELGISTAAARSLLGDVLDLRHRLPVLWGRLRSGEVVGWVARKVAHATRGLTVGQAGFVDTEVAEYADGRLPTGRFLALVDAAVIAADPDAAAAREHQAATEEFARVGRSNDHGQKTLYLRSSAASIIRIDATLSYLADALATLGDPGTLDQRRTRAALLLANPTQALRLIQTLHTHTGQQAAENPPPPAAGYQAEDEPLPDEHDAHGAAAADCVDVTDTAEGDRGGFFRRFRPDQVPVCGCRGGRWTPDTASLLPTVVLYLHLHQHTVDRDGRGVARWEGEGPISATYIRDFLGPHARFVIKPVLDLAHQASVDAYEVPDRLREAVHLRSPADMFPWATSTSRHLDADHTTPYRPPDRGGPPGQTHPDNLGFTNRYHHRVKTHGRWKLAQPLPGIYLWQAPHGATYLVDHTGTRQVRETQPPGTRHHDPRPAPGLPPGSHVECFFTDLLLHYEAA